MFWVYIIKCEDNYYYVGETSRLYRRFWEHQDGRGGVNTTLHKPEKILAIYKVDTVCKFFNYVCNVYNTKNNIFSHYNQNGYNKWLLLKFNEEYNIKYNFDYLEAENNIAECLIINNKENWEKIRGGKYTRVDAKYKFPTNKYLEHLPLCNCGIPCDIRKNDEKNLIFFRCAKKNMWENLKELFEIYDDPCNFYMEYTEDKYFREQEDEKYKKRKKELGLLYKKCFWLKNVEENKEYNEKCVGGCNKKEHEYTRMSYDCVEINLCYDCFINNNEELSKKYDDVTKGECLIKFKTFY
jgi:hypothetical protein